MNTKLMGLAIASLAVSAIAQTQQQSISQDGRPERMAKITFAKGLNTQDRSFIKDAAAGNNFEILTSKLAETHASSQWTKDFAKEMIQEHTGAQNELMDVAQQKGVDVKGNLPKPLQAKYDQLAKLNGDAFDKAYRQIQLKAHEMTSSKFKAQIKNGHDEDVREFAVKVLPAVIMHWKMAKTQTTMTGENKMTGGG